MAEINPLSQRDFSGGVNAVSNPYALGDKQVQRLRNLLLDEHGSLRTRDGFSVLTTAPTTTDPIVYRGILNRVGGSTTPFAIQNFSSGTQTLYNTSAEPWSVISSYASTEPIPDSVTMVNTEIIARGYLTPLQFDGTSANALTATAGQTVPPGAKHLAFHLGSLWVFNTSPTTTALDGPSALRMSDANEPNSWPNANQAFLAKDDGQEGMGLVSFTLAETGISPTQTLIAFKNYSTYQVTGVFGASTFSTQKAKTDMGCIAPRTIQFVSGFGVIRLTHKGFSLFNGVDDRLISEEVRPYLYGGYEISPLNLTAAAIGRSWAVQSQNPPLYIAACPVAGNALSRVFVYDLVRRTWSICDFPISFGCLNLISTPSETPTINAGTFTGGKIVSLFSGAESDDGTAVGWSVLTRPYFFGSPTRQAYWRRLIVDAHIGSAVVNVEAQFAGRPAINRTLSFPGGAAPALWGSGVWGTMVWGATGEADSRDDIDLAQDAPSVTFLISGNGHIHLRGLDIHGRPKPLTRAVR